MIFTLFPQLLLLLLFADGNVETLFEISMKHFGFYLVFCVSTYNHIGLFGTTIRYAVLKCRHSTMPETFKQNTSPGHFSGSVLTAFPEKWNKFTQSYIRLSSNVWIVCKYPRFWSLCFCGNDPPLPELTTDPLLAPPSEAGTLSPRAVI